MMCKCLTKMQTVCAKNCFQTTKKQANTISNIQSSKTKVLGFLKGFSGCEVWWKKGNTLISQIGTESQVNKKKDA